MFTCGNEPFSLQSVAEILRFLIKFSVFLIHVSKWRISKKKRRIRPRGSRGNSPFCREILCFSYIRPKTENFNKKTENNHVTSLSSTHCSALSAWPFRGNIIGFSRFRRKLVIFCTRDIYQNQRPFIKKYSRF